MKHASFKWAGMLKENSLLRIFQINCFLSSYESQVAMFQLSLWVVICWCRIVFIFSLRNVIFIYQYDFRILITLYKSVPMHDITADLSCIYHSLYGNFPVQVDTRHLFFHLYIYHVSRTFHDSSMYTYQKVIKGNNFEILDPYTEYNRQI